MPIFGRDGDGRRVASEPGGGRGDPPGRRSCARPASRRSRPCRRAPSADPGWFWGAAADDIGIAWDRRPTPGARPRGRTGLGALVAGRRLRLRAGRDRAEGRARPGRRGARLGGRGRRCPAADERGARGGGRGRRETAARPRRPAGRPRRDPPADARRDRGRRAGARPAAGHLHADLQRVRRPGDRDPARRLRGVDAHHRGRLPSPRVVGAAEGRRRRGGRGRPVGPAPAGRAARRRRDRDPVDAGSRRLVGRPGRRRVGRARWAARSTPRRRTC